MRQRKSGSDQRRRKRLEAKANAKVRAKGNGASEFVTRKEVNEAFQTYAQNLQKLGVLFNENQKGLRKAFELVDAHQAVMRRIDNDFLHRRVRPTPLHPEDVKDMAEGTFSDTRQFIGMLEQTIDYEWYFEQYNLTQCVIMMAESIRKFLKLDEVKEQPEPEPEEEPDFTFGGDYGEQNQIDG